MNDAVSRRVVIDTIHRMRNICDTNDIDDYHDLLTVAVDELPTHIASDCVSRQAAIDAVRDRMGKGETHIGDTFIECFEMILNALPSAQPYTEEEIQKIQDLEQAELDKAFELGQQAAQPELQWTLCDKMPDKSDVYLTVRVGYGVEQYEVLRYSPGVGFCRYSDEDGEYYSVPVHAWMPLPEPYKEKDNERA